LRSLEIYETHRIDYAEAYLIASADRPASPKLPPSIEASTGFQASPVSNPDDSARSADPAHSQIGAFRAEIV
jgi:hypothetical protein